MHDSYSSQLKTNAVTEQLRESDFAGRTRPIYPTTLIKRFTQPVKKADLGLQVNDTHSQLNSTCVNSVISIRSSLDIERALSDARRPGFSVCIAGGRHAMGGQQFLSHGILLDMRGHAEILELDAENGLVTVESGICWPDLIEGLRERQVDNPDPWVIIQKQTGADALTIGGALSANIHGRGLNMPPFVADIHSFVIVLADGTSKLCSRARNSELFSLAIGGYGAFGVLDQVTLRLQRRQLLRRTVRLVSTDNAISALESAKRSGAEYGDFQFAIDDQSEDFLATGIVSTYAPVRGASEPGDNKRLLSVDQWHQLLSLAHTDKTRAFDFYAKHYMSTDAQTYWSDTFQLSTYVENYHVFLDRQLNACVKGTELISELYVPRHRFAVFMQDAACFLRSKNADVVYGTVRLIEPDHETVLSWATQDWACIVFNLHVDHCEVGLAKAMDSFVGLIRLAIKYSGSFYLTYHRFAGAREVFACYPQMNRFLRLRAKYDPQTLFRSAWLDYCVSLQF